MRPAPGPGSANRWAPSEVDDAHILGQGPRVALDDPVDAIHGGVAEYLGLPGRGPAHFDRLDGRRATQPDLLLQAVAAEAPPGITSGIDVARAVGCRDAHLDARADRRAVRAPARKPERDPAVPVAGIPEQDRRRHVALEPPAHLLQDVLVAVVVGVAERNAVPLLEVADVGGDGDVLEHLPPGVAEQSVRDQCAERRLAVAEIDVGPAVVVEVTEVRAHRQCHAVEPYGVRHVAERPVVVGAVQSWHLGARLQPEVHRGAIALHGAPAPGDVRLLPPVLVVVPEPGREAVRRGHDTRLARHVGELPHIPGRARLHYPSLVLNAEAVVTAER